MAEVLKVLRAAEVGPDCIKTALEKITNDLAEDDTLREEYIQNGIVEALRGIEGKFMEYFNIEIDKF